LALRGTAAHVLDGGFPPNAKYGDLVEKLEKRYGTIDQSARFRNQLRGRHRLKGETLQALYDDVSRSALYAFPGDPTYHRDLYAVDAFVEALDDYQLELYVKGRDPVDL